MESRHCRAATTWSQPEDAEVLAEHVSIRPTRTEAKNEQRGQQALPHTRRT